MNDENRTPRSLKAAIAVVLILLLVGVFFRVRGELRMRHVRQLQEAMRNASPEQRAEKFQELRDGMRSLSQRDRERMMADGRQRFEDEMIRYTKLSKSEKEKYLDDRINRSPNFGGPPRNQGGRRPTNLSQEDRDRRRKQRLDQTSPEFRAAMDQFRRDMENRRRQRGMK